MGSLVTELGRKLSSQVSLAHFYECGFRTPCKHQTMDADLAEGS